MFSKKLKNTSLIGIAVMASSLFVACKSDFLEQKDDWCSY